jgi:hypothetical protein
VQENYQEKYKGKRLIGVPYDLTRGLKVVDNDRDLGTVVNVNTVRSTDPTNPNRTTYITIAWNRKGHLTKYHWELGWVVIGEDPDMAVRYQPPPQRMIQHTTQVSWFGRLRKFFGLGVQ